jgi:hypothetical protein
MMPLILNRCNSTHLSDKTSELIHIYDNRHVAGARLLRIKKKTLLFSAN